jgi:hypothetical protein
LVYQYLLVYARVVEDQRILRRLYSIPESAAAWCVSVPTVKRGIALGIIATITIGARRLIHESELERVAREGLDLSPRASGAKLLGEDCPR